MKRLFGFLAVLMVMSLVLGACGTPATETPAVDAPVTEPPAEEAPAEEAPAEEAPAILNGDYNPSSAPVSPFVMQMRSLIVVVMYLPT